MEGLEAAGTWGGGATNASPEPTEEQIASFIPLVQEHLLRMQGISQEIMAKLQEEQAKVQDIPVCERPDHHQHIEFMKQCDVNGDGRLDWDEYQEYKRMIQEHRQVKYGGYVPTDEAFERKWYDCQNALTEGEGVSKEDIDVTAKAVMSAFIAIMNHIQAQAVQQQQAETQGSAGTTELHIG